MTSLLADFRYSLRSIWKGRSITSLAVICLGIGVGLNATMFSVVDAVLLRPLPFHYRVR